MACTFRCPGQVARARGLATDSLVARGALYRSRAAREVLGGNTEGAKVEMYCHIFLHGCVHVVDRVFKERDGGGVRRVRGCVLVPGQTVVLETFKAQDQEATKGVLRIQLGHVHAFFTAMRGIELPRGVRVGVRRRLIHHVFILALDGFVLRALVISALRIQ